MLSSIALVSRTGRLVYWRQVHKDPDTLSKDVEQLHMFAALDLVRETLSNRSKKSKTAKDPFLGLVTPVENQYLYAYSTAGGVTLMALCKSERIPLNDVRSFFLRVYEQYVAQLLNPFSDPGESIGSETFVSKVTELSNTFSLHFERVTPT
ncbi:MAG: hypothetical protein MHM6MM_000969 [Cercozoa sp. M6MM]